MKKLDSCFTKMTILTKGVQKKCILKTLFITYTPKIVSDVNRIIYVLFELFFFFNQILQRNCLDKSVFTNFISYFLIASRLLKPIIHCIINLNLINSTRL